VGRQAELARERADALLISKDSSAADRTTLKGDALAEQRRLPLPIHLARPFNESAFAHPAEVELARLFSFYRVRWVYEPTTFHLEVDDEGRPLEQVTPDFYLPDHDVYVELTTMRQSLVTRKNRKIRRLKEAFPTVQVKLIYRKDYDRLIGSYLTPPGAECTATPGKPLFSEKQIDQRIIDLATEMIAGDDPPPQLDGWRASGCAHGYIAGPKSTNGRDTHALCLIGLGKGSRRFLDMLEAVMRSRGEPVEADWLSLTRYAEAGSDKRVRIGRRPRLDFSGRDVTLVTDVVSTGLSAAFAMQWLERHGACSVRICTLLDREDARILEVPIVHAGFRAPHDVLVGYGISFMSQFEELPHIAALKAPPKSKGRAQAAD
jgi:hypoxanthine phosphoribosyltransferase